MRRPTSAWGVGLILAVVAFLHVEGLAATDGQPKQGGILRIGLRKDITRLNPLSDFRSTTGLVFGLVYEGLIEVNEKQELVPNLAESWTVSKDGTEYVLQLRKGVLFHNGKELDAEDVKWTFDYIHDPKYRAYAYTNIKPVQKMEVLDKYSFKLTLKEPFTPLLAIGLSGNTVILPKNSFEGRGREIETAPAGTGPFALVEWNKGSLVKLVANKKYRGGRPYLDELHMRPAPSGDVRFVSMRSGDLDLIEEIPYAAVSEIKAGKHPTVRLSGARISGYRMLKINTQDPHFKDPRVRRAVAYAIDRKAYIHGAAFGHGEPAYQSYPTGHKWYFNDVKNIEMDLEKAKALLAEAGYPDGFKTKLEVRRGEEAENLMFQDQLKKIGIDLEMQGMDYASFLKSHVEGTFSVVISGSDVYPDPDRALYYNFRTEKAKGNRNTRNRARYSNPEVDRLLDQARVMPNSPERRELYRKATQIIINEAPHVDLAFITRYYAYRDYVKGFNTNENGDLAHSEGGLPVTWLDKGRK